MKKQSKQNQQIAKAIQRQQIIGYKKKTSNTNTHTNDNKNANRQKQSDDEIQSAHSLKSGVLSQDTEGKFSKKNTPLPELYRDKDKKRIFHRNFATSQTKVVNNYLEKQVRQQDILVLKQKNNYLTTQNMKLKTKVMALQKQINKFSKNQDQKPRQLATFSKDPKIKGNQLLSLKMIIKNLRKQLDEQKTQNQKIKWSIKFTRINQLQIQRQQILNETTRLRQLLDQQMVKRASQKIKQQGLSNIQQRLHSLTQKNLILMKQNAQLNKKIKNSQDLNKKSKPISQNQKNLSKMLFNAKKIIKQKQKQIQTLKVQGSSTQAKIQSIKVINSEMKSMNQVPAQKVDNKNDKRTMSKSAQKYRKKGSEQTSQGQKCDNCAKLKKKITDLQKNIQQLTNRLKMQKQNLINMGQFSRQEIKMPTNQQVQILSKFLTYRFKAHHLSLQDVQKYLINNQITQTVKKQLISVIQLAESLVAQPFSLLSNRYLQICIIKLFYRQQYQKNNKKQAKIKIDQNKKLTKGQILANFTKFINPFQVMPQQKQQQMFIQIAQLVTNYHQHILTALNRKKNGQGTISQLQFIDFFNQIELQKQFVDFIICQIILESLDMQHLNYYTMFQIFYMPNQGQLGQQPEQNQPNKKKFQVDHSQVVKQQDQQYQESKSHIDVRQKTLSKKDQQEQYQQQQEEEYQSPHQHSQKQKYLQEQQIQHQFQKQKDKRNRKNHSLKNVNSSKPMNQKQKIPEKSKQKQKKTQTHPKQKIEQKQQLKQQYQQEYEAQFEQEKMDQLPQEQKANQQDISEDEDYKPYMLEQIHEDEQNK